MFRLFARKPNRQASESDPQAPMQTLVEKLAADRRPYTVYDLRGTALGQQILALGPGEQREFVSAAVSWLGRRGLADAETWPVRAALLALLRRKLPLELGDVIALLDWSMAQPNNYARGAPQMAKVVEDYLRAHTMTPPLHDKVEQLVSVLDDGYKPPEVRRAVARLRQAGNPQDTTLPLVPGEAWSDAAIAAIGALESGQQKPWVALLNACAHASGSAPSGRWLSKAEPLLEAIGWPAFRQTILLVFPLVDRPRTQPITSWPEWQPDPNAVLHESNAAILRGLVWLCAQREDTEIAQALTRLAVSAYRKVPKRGPRCVAVGNACLWALGQMQGQEGAAQLAILKARVKINSAQKSIEKALAAAAERVGLAPEEIEELVVPTYGLDEVGCRRETLGEFTAELSVTGTDAVEFSWLRADGKRQASVPKAVRADYAEELKELQQAVQEIRHMLPAQRDRLERLYLEQRQWPLDVWRARYLDHPLVGTLARRLIWKFSRGDRAASGIWYEGCLVGRDGRPLEWLDDTTRVELWHPLQVDPDVVLAWRTWLDEHEVRQPTKQAHREVYLLTDAERATGTYSNRFAAHIVRQHQFNALCAARGWRNKLRLMVDDEYPPATRLLPKWGLRAEFWVESVGQDYGTDTNDAGTFLYLSTDQVRFYALDAPEHLAHAMGGGYYENYPTTPAQPVPLEQVPPLVFAEIMRDVDLFVGVASVANDPTWADGGPQVRYREYWARYAFGDLSETARTRRQVLESLLPRLKIAGRCRLTERFLVVRGDWRTYKIHLGSGNILMEPSDEYLCIVPAQGTAAGPAGKVFLPFEGDGTLTIILSKAFLLAEDTRIKDPTILRQIKHR